uniref:Uncharacterized protein n=1 Tax=Anguilla anguilla TaxID=7936 RepID=A0A0E9PTS2_ANGAN
MQAIPLQCWHIGKVLDEPQGSGITHETNDSV